MTTHQRYPALTFGFIRHLLQTTAGRGRRYLLKDVGSHRPRHCLEHCFDITTKGGGGAGAGTGGFVVGEVMRILSGYDQTRILHEGGHTILFINRHLKHLRNNQRGIFQLHFVLFDFTNNLASHLEPAP